MTGSWANAVRRGLSLWRPDPPFGLCLTPSATTLAHVVVPLAAQAGISFGPCPAWAVRRSAVVVSALELLVRVHMDGVYRDFKPNLVCAFHSIWERVAFHYCHVVSLDMVLAMNDLVES
jgi:hypothetical protein